MRDTSEMTVAELEAEFDAVWDRLRQVPDHLYEEPGNEPLRDRLHSLSAALHWKRLDVQAREDWQKRTPN